MQIGKNKKDIIMNKKYIISSICSVILLSGCATKINNRLTKKYISNGFKASKDIDIRKDIKEKKVKDFYIDFSICKDLKSALKKLNEMDPKHTYLLKGETNIIFPTLSTEDSKKLNIHTFEGLRKFVESVSPYTIYIENPNKSVLKAVKIIEKVKIKNDITYLPVRINGTHSLKEIFDAISKVTGYTIVFVKDGKNIFTPSKNISFQTKLENDYIDYNGKTLGGLLNYIAKQFNYFIDIDYQKKQIVLQKYKTFSFPLLIPDLKTQIGTNLDKTSSEKGSIATNSDILQYTYVSNYIEDFIKNLRTFVPNSQITYSGGIVYAKTTYNDYQIISKLINNFNNEFLKQANVKVDVYVFLVSKKTDIGTDLAFSSKYVNSVTKYLTTNLLTASNEANNPSVKRKGMFNLDNTFIKYVKHYSFDTNIVNNMPQIINLTTDKSYIQSIQTTTTTSTATTTTTQTEIGHIIQGQSLTLFPKIYSNKVSLKIMFKNSNNDSLIEKNFGDNIVMLPTNTNKNIPINTVLKFGEKKIAGIFQIFADANNFKGIVPIENFIIGGNSQHQYVRTIIAVVVSVKK
jgi:hypothetical protein